MAGRHVHAPLRRRRQEPFRARDLPPYERDPTVCTIANDLPISPSVRSRFSAEVEATTTALLQTQSDQSSVVDRQLT